MRLFFILFLPSLLFFFPRVSIQESWRWKNLFLVSSHLFPFPSPPTAIPAQIAWEDFIIRVCVHWLTKRQNSCVKNSILVSTRMSQKKLDIRRTLHAKGCPERNSISILHGTCDTKSIHYFFWVGGDVCTVQAELFFWDRR